MKHTPFLIQVDTHSENQTQIFIQIGLQNGLVFEISNKNNWTQIFRIRREVQDFLSLVFHESTAHEEHFSMLKLLMFFWMRQD